MFARKSIYALTAGTLLAASVPAFADHGHWDRDYEYGHGRAPAIEYRYPARPVVVERRVERRVVERPVYVGAPRLCRTARTGLPAGIRTGAGLPSARLRTGAWAERPRDRRRRDRRRRDRQPGRIRARASGYDRRRRSDRRCDRQSVLIFRSAHPGGQTGRPFFALKGAFKHGHAISRENFSSFLMPLEGRRMPQVCTLSRSQKNSCVARSQQISCVAQSFALQPITTLKRCATCFECACFPASCAPLSSHPHKHRLPITPSAS